MTEAEAESMRRIFAVLLVPAVLLAASCTGNESRPTYNASTTLSSGVKGDLSYVGGPLVVSPTARHLEPGDVVAFAQDGTQAGAIHFPEGQGFSLSLPPGEYGLVATSGDARCPDRLRVTVSPNSYEAVHIRCDVK
jgi:hypothetical protein